MAPLSVLPGRLRFEANCLVGSKEGCASLEESVLSVPGISEASASHRTGRVLVRFDESLITLSEVEEHLGTALRSVAEQKETGAKYLPARRAVPSREATSGVGHFVMEMALHAFLPAPLDLLLPTAATVLRR